MSIQATDDTLQLKLTPDQKNTLIDLLKKNNLWDKERGSVIDTLKQSTPPVGEFGEIYNYISSIIKGSPSVNRNTKYWFSAAGFINSNIRSEATVNYIRDSTQYGLEFRGKLTGYTQAQIDAGIQQTSNYIGQNVISQILKDQGIPSFPKMLSYDIGAAILTPMPDPNFGQDAGGWGGTFYFWNEQLNYGNTLNRPRVNVGDAVINGLASEDIPVVNGVQMPAQPPSMREFMYANTQAASDAAIRALTGISGLASIGSPDEALKDLSLRSGSAFEAAVTGTEDAMQALSASHDAETPEAIKNRLKLNTFLEVASRLLTGHLKIGPQVPAGTTSSDATRTMTGNVLTLAYNNGDEIDETMAIDDGTVPSAHWKTADGASGDISVAFDANGALTESDTWENRFGIGSTGTDTYNSDGSSTGTINYAGGGYVTYIEDAQGNITTDYYTSSGNLYMADWVHADGSSGTETMFANGQTDTPHGSGSNFSVPQSDYITLVNPDGSYWTRSNDVQDTLHTTVVDAQGVASAQTDTTGDGMDYERTSNTSSIVTKSGGSITNFRDGQGHLTHDSWTATDGTSGIDTYYASGAISGKTTHTDGSSDTYALYQTPGGAASTFNASSLVNISVLGALDLTRDHLNADGTLASDTWNLSDGASGQDSFDTSGSGSGAMTRADGSTSTVALDGSGDITIDNRSSNGSLTSQDWWKADGTRGIKTYNADGVLSTTYDYQLNGKVVVTQWAADGTAEDQQTAFAGSLFSLDGSGFGKIVNTDGSYSVNYNDANGDALIFKYSMGGQLQGTDHVSASRGATSEFSGTFADGTAWSSPYNPQTPVVTQADGTQYVYYTDTSGRETGDDWVKLDGSHGSDTFYADGSSRSDNFNADGTSVTIADDGKENITNLFFGADGTETGDAWQKADSSHGGDTYAADGSSSGSTYSADGSALAYTDDGHGNDEQTTYAVGGAITDDLRDYADGSRVYTAFNGDGSGTRTYDTESNGQEVMAVESFDPAGLSTLTTTTTTFDDSSSQVVSDDGKGNIERRAFDPTGTLISDTWAHSDGSRGVTNFGAGGTGASTTVTADGRITTVVTQGSAQDSTTNVYDASGARISQAWARDDGTHGMTTYTDAGQSSTTYLPDGTHTVEEVVYGVTYTTSYYSAAGVLTSKDSRPADGGAITRTTYHADGSYSVAVGFRSDTANPDVTVSEYSAGGALLQTTLTHPDGSNEGTIYNGDGSYSSFAKNAQGDVSRTTYSAAGVRTGDSTQNAGGLASSQTIVDGAGNATTTHFDAAGHALWKSWLNADGSSGRSNLAASSDSAYNDFLKSGQYSVANVGPLNQEAGHSVKGDTYNSYGSSVTDTQLNFEILDAAGNPVLMVTGNRSPNLDGGPADNFDAVSAFLTGGAVADFGNGLSQASLSSDGKVLLDADGTLHYARGTAQGAGQGTADDSVENFQPVLGVTRDAANQAFEAIVANQTVTPQPPSPPTYAASTTGGSPTVSIKYLSPDQAAAMGSQQVPAGSSVQIQAMSIPAGQPLPAYLVGHAVLDAASQTYKYFALITTVAAPPAVLPPPEPAEVYTTGTIDESFQTPDGVQTEHYEYRLGSYGNNQSPYLLSESFVGNDGRTASFDVQGEGEDTDNHRAHFVDGTDAYKGHGQGQTLQNQADGASARIGDVQEAIADAQGTVLLGQTNGETIDEKLPGVQIGTSGVNDNYWSPRPVVVNVATADRHMALSFDANNQLTSDEWSDKDGTTGKITYASDGSSQGVIEYADGNYSQTSNDAQNNYRVKNFEVDGMLTSEVWGTAGGSSGTDFYDAQGASHGEVDNVDGSYSHYVSDGLGNTTTQTYSATDVLLSDNWVHADGTHGSTVYATTTPGSTTTHSDDGSYRVATIDANGNVTINSYTSIGALTHEKWSNVDGSHGENSYASDGSGTGVNYGADGSLGRSTFYADGSSSTTTINVDKSYVVKTIETNGDTNTQSYNATGEFMAGRWTRTDGSHGDGVLSPDGSVTGSGGAIDVSLGAQMSLLGSGNTVTLAGNNTLSVSGQGDAITANNSTISFQGDSTGDTVVGSNNTVNYFDDTGQLTERDNYGVDGALKSDTWTKADGSHGSDVYGTDGTFTSTATDADGNYATTVRDSGGNVTAKVFSAAGVLVSDFWSKADGTSGENVYASNGSITKAVTVDADGAKTVKDDDGLGNVTTTLYDSAGNKTSDSWQKADGTHGTHQRVDDSWAGQSFAVDGSHVDTAQDALGNTTSAQYDNAGTLLSNSWTHVDGTHGARTFATDGSSVATSYNSNGSYSQTTTDASGNTLTNFYSATGVLTRDTWHHADGTSGHDNLSATSGDANANFRKNGVYAINTPSSDGAENIIKIYDASGNFIYSIDEYQPDSNAGYGGEVGDAPDISLISTQQITSGPGGASLIQGIHLDHGSGQLSVDEEFADGSDFSHLWTGVDQTELLGKQTVVSRSTFSASTANGAGAEPLNFDVIRPDGSGLAIQKRDGTTYHYGGGANSIDLSGNSIPGTILSVYPRGGLGGVLNYAGGSSIIDTVYSAGGTDRTTVLDGYVTSDTWADGQGASGSYMYTDPPGVSPGQVGNGASVATYSTRNAAGYSYQSTSVYGSSSHTQEDFYYPDATLAETHQVSADGAQSLVLHDPSGNTVSSTFSPVSPDSGDKEVAKNVSIDQNGDVITTVYTYHWAGTYSGETATSSWTTKDGTQVQATFDLSTGAGTQQMNYADGTWTYVVNDALGGYVAQNYDTEGHLVGDQTQDHGGQTLAHTYNADGSYSIHTDNGQGYEVDKNYSNAGLALTDTWTFSGNNSHGSDIYSPDGTATGTWSDPAGDHGDATFDANGQMLTANYFESNGSFGSSGGAHITLTGSGNSVFLMGNDTLSVTGQNNVITATSSTIRFNGDSSGDQVTGSNNTVEYFDDAGQEIRSDSFDSQGHLSGVTTFSNGVRTDTAIYDASGVKTADALFDASGAQTDYLMLDATGQVTQDQQFRGGYIADAINASNGVVTDEAFYDASQNKTADAVFNAAGVETEYKTFNSAGQIVQDLQFSDGHVTQATNYSNGVKTDAAFYDAAGNETGDALFDSSGAQTDYLVFDGNGQVSQDQQVKGGNVVDAINYSNGVETEEDFYSSSQQLTEAVTFDSSGNESGYYKFDTSGQLTQAQIFSDGHVSQVYHLVDGGVREIDYYSAAGAETGAALLNGAGAQTDYIVFDTNGQTAQDQQFANGYVADAINYNSQGVAVDEAFYNSAGQQTGDTVFTTSAPGPAAITTSVNQLIQAMASFAPPAAVHSNMAAANSQQFHAPTLAVPH